MSLVLNGTSQYVSLGDAVDIRSATPILIVAVVAVAYSSATIVALSDNRATTTFGSD